MTSEVQSIRNVDNVRHLTVFGLGAVAGAFVALFHLLVRSSGYPALDLEMLLGSFITSAIDTDARALGSLAAIVMSGLVAFTYAFILRSARRSGAMIGLNLALFHWLIDGCIVGLLSLIHPVFTNFAGTPGFFALGGGLDFATSFLTAHLIYGAAIGILFDRAAIHGPLS